MKKIYELVLEKLRQEGQTAEISVEDGEAVLYIFADKLGSKKNGNVVMELDTISIEGEDHSYFQLFTVIANNIPPEPAVDIILWLNDLNVSTLLGCYGVIEDEGLMYHRYAAKLSNGSDEQTADELFELIFDVLGVINNDLAGLFDEFG